MTLAVEPAGIIERGNDASSPAQPFGVVPSSRICRLRENLSHVKRAEFVPPESRQLRNFKARDLRERQKLGLRYERAVMLNVAKHLPGVLGGPWIRYWGRESGVCQPDGVWHEGGRALVIEVKLVHTLDAWHQLRGKYVPVIRALYMTEDVEVLNIVRTFDPSISWPEDQLMFDDMDAALKHRSPGYKVLVWRGR